MRKLELTPYDTLQRFFLRLLGSDDSRYSVKQHPLRHVPDRHT